MKSKIVHAVFVFTFAFWINGAIANTNLPAGMPAEGEISSPYNPDADLKGLTILTEAAVPVIATADGVVRMSGAEDRYGEYVYLYHPREEKSYMTLYLFLGEVSVQPGETVTKGEVIGYSGMTPANQPGLIYKMREAGVTIDPTPFIRGEFDN